MAVAVGEAWSVKSLEKKAVFWAGEVERLRGEIRRVIEASEARTEPKSSA